MSQANLIWVLKCTVMFLAIIWGLTDNGAGILLPPSSLSVTFGNYFTEIMAAIIAWIGYDLYAL